ncbi:MAG: TIGR03545 family protein, partial [Desulfobacteraceae bacterium]|nr:TIGR03545 family protein [Desulfobacteraceae bacterium]
EDIQKNISHAEKKFKKKLENLVDEKKLEEYRKRIEQIRKKDSSSFAILGSVIELREVYKEIEDDLDDIHDVRKEFKTELKKFQKGLKNLSAARLSDIERLKNKYSFLKGDKLNLSKLLFRQTLCSQLQKYSNWIALAEPYFDLSKKQENTHEPKNKSGDSGFEKPDKSESSVYLLIQNMKANILLKKGVLTGKATNITNMPIVAGVPTTFNFSGKDFQGLDLFDFKGIMNLVDSMHPHHEASLDVSGLLLENFEFSDKPDLSMAIVKSLMNLGASFKLDDNKLRFLARTQFNKVVMSAKSLNGSELQKSLAKTLTGINKFNLVFDINGVDDEYTVAIKSDLDNVLKNIAEKMLKTRVGSFEKDLKTGVLSKTAKPVKQSNKSFTDFNKIGGQLSLKSAQSKDLLNEID